MASNSTPTEPALKRVFLWTNARSLGSVLLKCLSQISDAKMLNGLYTSCFMHRPDAAFPKGVPQFEEGHKMDAREEMTSEFTDLYDASKVSYSHDSWAKTQMECEYPGKKYLIVRDLALSIRGNFDLITAGFRHTFLIRHPHRMWTSWKARFSPYYPEDNLKDAVNNNFNGSFSYKDQYDIIEHLMNNPETYSDSLDAKGRPIILDADDLQTHPESVLQQYCNAIGVPYTDDLLHWNPGIDLMKDWKVSCQMVGGGLEHGDWGYYKAFLESSQFLPPKKLPDKDELDEDVLECAEMCFPYYEKMYGMRTIRP